MSKKLRNKLSPAFIWTEIMSVIKGGSTSQNYISNVLPRHIYEKEKNITITRKEARVVYWVYLQYESWKIQSNAFDFLDVVGHILYYTKRHVGFWAYWKKSIQIDYLIVDEV